MMVAEGWCMMVQQAGKFWLKGAWLGQWLQAFCRDAGIRRQDAEVMRRASRQRMPMSVGDDLGALAPAPGFLGFESKCCAVRGADVFELAPFRMGRL